MSNSIYSNQTWFCTNCGTKEFLPMVPGCGSYGKEWKCCSLKCSEEMNLKFSYSVLGKEYRPTDQQKFDLVCVKMAPKPLENKKLWNHEFAKQNGEESGDYGVYVYGD